MKTLNVFEGPFGAPKNLKRIFMEQYDKNSIGKSIVLKI